MGAKHTDVVAFCFNGTDALNLCLKGILRPKDRALATVTEHNSVLRPMRSLEQSRDIHLGIVDCDHDGYVTTRLLERCLDRSIRLVVVSHASNVTGAVQDLTALGNLAHEFGAVFMVDAAQTAGSLPIDMHAMNIDILASSGHKGMLGPMGTGFVILRQALIRQIDSFRHGGTGTHSETDVQPEHGDAKFESGSLNVAGIAGLDAAIDHLDQHGDAHRCERKRLTKRLLDGFNRIPELTLYGPPGVENRNSVVSFNVGNQDCHEVAMLLESEFDIHVRAGLHCAPRMHQALDTLRRGGTVRASIGSFNTDAHIDRLLDGVGQLASAR